VIDVFFKIKELSALGVEIYLHTYEYGRGVQKELNNYCKKVFYYKRNSFLKSFLSSDPFIVKSRSNDLLISNLNEHRFPILFEGLHTTFPIYENELMGQPVFVRAHNIEHRFYKGLSESETHVFKKRFFKQEAKKLKKYQTLLKKVQGVFTISPFEQVYFKQKIGAHCHYIPAFHQTLTQKHKNTKGKNILYHGNISVSENVKAAQFLIDVYKDSPFELVIASSYTNEALIKETQQHSNISFLKIDSDEMLSQLFEEAHINALPTFQKTGIKLKLLNTLYQGKFVIANDYMVEDTGLESLCTVANTKKEFLLKTKELFEQDFTSNIVTQRIQVLEDFSPKKGAQKIVDLIFG
jgi:hypothetical protein